ncbi:hypothetical protein CRG98_007586 [Punica granatum]|uniref:CCHC-type domain-containing protein n=1 Tax=Punica granatum TaxID=22663 RepID=A0A2I0KUN2_PUNGR|nr:hypothetical protein CRG98_007586 [Punica granatum]
MDSELQKQYENMRAYDMIVYLRQLYQEQARHERFEISKAPFQARTAEHDISKGMPVLLVQGTKRKGKCKSKGKKAKGASKYDLDALKPKTKVAKDDYCFHCGNTGHWKRNCKESRRSSRIRHEPERYGFLATQDNDVLLIDNDEPTTYAKVVIGPDSEKWLEAMRFEMESMYTNQVWTLVDPPEGVKPIGCKWVFKKKTDMDVKEFGFIKNEDEPCVYKKVSGSIVIFLVLYVDDILLIGNDIPSLQSVKSWLGRCFSMKDLSEATYVLELAVVPSIADPVDLHCDNNGAIAQAKELRSHQRSKHILRRFHLIREIIDKGDVKICRIPTDENLLDPLTKPLVQRKYEAHTRSIGIREMPNWL